MRDLARSEGGRSLAAVLVLLAVGSLSLPDAAAARSASVTPEARGRAILLTCLSGGFIRVATATYGKNCGAETGNATADLAARCDGLSICGYYVRHAVLGDPVPSCSKDYVAEWSCRVEKMNQ